jgi:Gpi18-like mannosyltransferase
MPSDPSPGPSERASTWRIALLLTLGLRMVYSVFAAVSSLVSPVNIRLMRSNAFTETLSSPNHSARYLLLNTWSRFDTLWYLHIARYGYDRPAAIVFYPLYPLLIKQCGTFLGSDLASALFISTVAAFFVFWGFQKLLLLDFSYDQVQRSLLICAMWPASFIYFAGYAESLLLAFILWSLYAARRDRWWLATLLAFLAGTTKATGLLVCIPLAVFAWRSRTIKASSIILAPLGTVAFLFWMQHRGLGSPTAAYLQDWHTKMSFPWTTLWNGVQAFIHYHNLLLGLNLFFLLLFCCVVVINYTELAYTLFGISAILLFLIKQTDPLLQSTIRYLLIIFPVYVGLGRWFESPRLKARIRMLCTALFIANLGLLWLFQGWSLVL